MTSYNTTLLMTNNKKCKNPVAVTQLVYREPNQINHVTEITIFRNTFSVQLVLRRGTY